MVLAVTTYHIAILFFFSVSNNHYFSGCYVPCHIVIAELLSTTTIISSSISRLCHVELTTHVANFRFLCHGRRTKWSYLFINCWRDSGKRWIWMRGREKKTMAIIYKHIHIFWGILFWANLICLLMLYTVFGSFLSHVSACCSFFGWGLLLFHCCVLQCLIVCLVVVSNADSDGEQKGKQQRQRPLK